MPTTPSMPDDPIDRLSLLIADLTSFAVQGGMPEESARFVYDELMPGLAAIDVKAQALLLDRVRAWSEPPVRAR